MTTLEEQLRLHCFRMDSHISAAELAVEAKKVRDVSVCVPFSARELVPLWSLARSRGLRLLGLAELAASTGLAPAALADFVSTERLSQR